VREIPAECIQEVRLKTAVTRPVSFQRNSARGETLSGARLSDSGEDSGFKLGQPVRHRLFGEGVIVRFEGSGPNGVIEVNFAEVGKKRLVAQYAKLEAM
jgi:DNA helicase II / ATP-dependent DNA helicase PcrA